MSATQHIYPSQPETRPCDRCDQPATLIPYHETTGCGGAIIALWRCANGHSEFGDIIGYDTCDYDLPHDA
jgi:hypothetical protein